MRQSTQRGLFLLYLLTDNSLIFLMSYCGFFQNMSKLKVPVWDCTKCELK